MIKIYSAIILLCSLLLTSCSEGEDKDYDITGTNLGASHHVGGFTLFVEDNINGQEIDFYADYYQNFDKESYELEAYQMLLNKDTVVIADKTGEEVVFEEDEYGGMHPFFWMYNILFNDVAVKTAEDFESQVLSDREYILWERSFLPAYTAEEVRVYPVAFEDYLAVTGTRGEDMVYVLQVIDEITDYDDFYPEYEEFYEEIHQYSTSGFHVFYSYLEHKDWEIFNEPLEIEEFPVYYITDETGLIEVAENKERVFEFLDNM